MNNTKTNQAFLAAYIDLDKTCSEKLDTSKGVTDYIDRLTNLRFAYGRGEILPRLIKYRKIRNRIAHEPGAMKELSELSKADISWLKKFNKKVGRGKDPVSKYLKNAGARAKLRALVRVCALIGAALLVIAVIAAIAFYK